MKDVMTRLLLLLLAGWMPAAALLAQTTTIAATADTYIRQGSPNQNQGQETVLHLQQSGNNRSLARMDQGQIAAAVSDGSLASATLELYVKSSGSWGATGRTVDLHRLTASWTESGATWNCAEDSNPANSQPNCAAQWAGGTFEPEATDSVLHTHATTGWLSFNVTGDVRAFLSGAANHGWLLKLADEGQNGNADYGSRQGLAAQAPRLVLVVESSTFDQVPPVLAITSPSLPVLINEPTPQIELAYADGGSGVDTASLSVAVDGTAAVCTAGPASATCLPTALTEGEHTITATFRDLAGNQANSARSFSLLIGPGLRSAAFSAVADTYLRQGPPNRNFGGAGILRVRQGGKNRALVRFDAAEIAALLAQGTLESASLELTIAGNGHNWGPNGRTVDAHRLTADWTEAGATWNCPHDTDLGNAQPNCPQQWAGGSFQAAPTATVLHTNGLTGKVTFDVTADLAAFVAGTPDFGWIVKKTAEGQSGAVDYASREAGAATASRLIVVLDVPGGGEDQEPPTITAAVDPPPNAAGWHNTDVAVTFTCSDAGSGVASCPAPVTVATEGFDLRVSGTATDEAGNSASVSISFNLDKQAPRVAISSPSPGITVEMDHIALSGTLNDLLAGVEGVRCDGVPAQAGSSRFDCAASLLPGPNTVRVEATDRAGNTGSEERAIFYLIDTIGPQVQILAPAAGSFVTERRPLLEVTYSDAKGVEPASLAFASNGLELPTLCQSGPSRARCQPQADLPEGLVTLVADVADSNGNLGGASASFLVDSVPLTVAILAPANGAITRDETTTVTGEVSVEAVDVSVNGVAASLSGGSFSATVPLREGTNMLVAVARKSNGVTGTASIETTRDIFAPIVHIDSPRDGLVAATPRLAVTGLVNDIVHGNTIAQVEVNGAPAQVAGGAFLLEELELEPGENLIEAVGTDAAGNVGRHRISVIFQPPVGERVVLVSGNGQNGEVLQLLAQPLVIRVEDEAGNPVAGRVVTFAVSRNSGLLSPPSAGPESRTMKAVSDGGGLVAARLRLGHTAAEGGNRVRVTGLGLAGEVELCATGMVGEPNKILMTMGDNQRGVAGYPLPTPIEALVLDAASNAVPGVQVTFTVIEGSGHLDGALSLVRTTSVAGLARAVVTLGSAPGINNNVVAADFAGNPGIPATFAASGLIAGEPGATRLSGVVLDNSHTPIPGATVEVAAGGVSRSSVTDAEGQFTLTAVPVGHVHLHIEPGTSPRPELFPPLAFETVTVAGHDNTIGQPISIPALDPVNSAEVGGAQDVTIQMAGVTGLTLTVFANSVSFPDGSRQGSVNISQVHLDKVPMQPPSGTYFMPPAWTVQPHGVVFNPPARITIPNDGLAPGQVIDIYQFDHALNQFVNVGKGTTSEDASIITSDPGFGITRAGWGGCGQPPPDETCAEGCDDNNLCTNDRCVNGRCEHPPAADESACPDDGSMCTRDVCMGGACTHPELPEDQRPECQICMGGRYVPDPARERMQCMDEGTADCSIDRCMNGTCTHTVLQPVAAYAPDPEPLDTGGLGAAAATGLTCLQNAVAAAGGTFTLNSAFRPQAYQDHLVAVWNAIQALNALGAYNEAECTAVIQGIRDEEARHGLRARPANVSNHGGGNAFDATIRNLPAGTTIDGLATGCGLSRPHPGADPVHFEP